MEPSYCSMPSILAPIVKSVIASGSPALPFGEAAMLAAYPSMYHLMLLPSYVTVAKCQLPSSTGAMS